MTGTIHYTEPRNVQRRFKNILEKCDLPPVTFHSLRHSFATRCIEKGADSKALSEILGHSSVKITLDIYVHSNMEQKREYINQMTI
jgi:integrase